MYSSSQSESKPTMALGESASDYIELKPVQVCGLGNLAGGGGNLCCHFCLLFSVCVLFVFNNNNNNNNNRIQRRSSRFFTISSQCPELSPTRTLKWPGRNRVQITCNTSSADHVEMSCYVPLGTKGQLSY